MEGGTIMDFEAWLKSKKIDPQKFKNSLPEDWDRNKKDFDQSSPASFDQHKKFFINNLRLEFPLDDQEKTE